MFLLEFLPIVAILLAAFVKRTQRWIDVGEHLRTTTNDDRDAFVDSSLAHFVKRKTNRIDETD
jgi:hypothetical protein